MCCHDIKGISRASRTRVAGRAGFVVLPGPYACTHITQPYLMGTAHTCVKHGCVKYGIVCAAGLGIPRQHEHAPAPVHKVGKGVGGLRMHNVQSGVRVIYGRQFGEVEH